LPRTPKPWFWASRQSYYVTIRGERFHLGPDKGAADPRFHELMAPHRHAGSPVDAARAARGRHRRSLPRLVPKLPGGPDLQVVLGPHPGLPRLAAGRRRPGSRSAPAVPRCRAGGLARRFTRRFPAERHHGDRAAVQLGGPPGVSERHAPRPHRDAPRPAPRAGGHTRRVRPDPGPLPPDDPFRTLLGFSRDTGCPPHEVTRKEARHVDLAGPRVTFAAQGAMGRRRPRVIHLTGHATRLLAASSRKALLVHSSRTRRDGRGRGSPSTADFVA
jgi:hypothetical protein